MTTIDAPCNIECTFLNRIFPGSYTTTIDDQYKTLQQTKDVGEQNWIQVKILRIESQLYREIIIRVFLSSRLFYMSLVLGYSGCRGYRTYRIRPMLGIMPSVLIRKSDVASWWYEEIMHEKQEGKMLATKSNTPSHGDCQYFLYLRGIIQNFDPLPFFRDLTVFL